VGFQRKRTYLITWDEGELAGFEMRVKSMSLDDVITLTASASSITPESAAAGANSVIEGLLEQFAAFLVSWNLEDEDNQPVPATLAGLRSQDVPFLLQIIKRGLSAITDVDIPLPGGSNSGETSAEAPPPELGLASLSQAS
jgi:hypothetical protein